MMLSMKPKSRALVAAAKFLLVANILIFVGAYYALPAYQKMHPQPNGFAEIVGFEVLTAIDVVAAALLLKQWMRTGIALFAATSSIWCGYSIVAQLEAGKSVANLWAPLIAYWDVALLAFLIWRTRSQHSTPNGALQ